MDALIRDEEETFDVTMDDVVFMAVLDAEEELTGQRTDLVDGKHLVFDNARKIMIQIFHHHCRLDSFRPVLCFLFCDWFMSQLLNRKRFFFFFL